MPEKAKIPGIRFKCFTDAWEQRKLSEVVNFLDEQRKPLESGLREPGPFPYYGASGIIDYVKHYLFDEELILLSEDGANIIDRNYRVCFIARGKYWVNNHAHVLKSKDNYCNGFICESLERLDYVQYNTGTAQPKLNQEVCRNITILAPKIEEQELISTYLERLDNLITLHQRKLLKLKNVKKAMLEKMFPKNAKNVPEIRFVGFADAWEERELSAWADRYDNLRVPIKASNRVSGSTPYYGANGIQDYVEGYTHDGEFILIAEDGANDLKNYPVQYVNGRIWVNNHAHVLQAKKKIADNKFLKYVISQTNIEPYLVGGGRAKLNANTMMRISIVAPENLDEQEQIGSLFQLLDNLIILHQGKHEKLQNLKKAFLEKMFV